MRANGDGNQGGPLSPSGPLLAYDPVVTTKEAAEYMGVCTKTLREPPIERQPLPGRGRKRPRFGYRLSALNPYLDRLKDPEARSL